MAKKAATGGSKSQSIRDYLAKNPGASPKQIVADLKEQGIDVSLGLANVVKYSAGRKGGRKKVKRGRPAGTRNGTTGLTMEHLLAVKRLADELGGTDQVRRALEVLEKLS